MAECACVKLTINFWDNGFEKVSTGLCDVFAQNTARAPRACSRLLHSDEMAGRRAVTVQLLSGPREAMIQVSSLYITSFSKCGVFKPIA